MSSDPDFKVYRSEYLDYLETDELQVNERTKILRGVLTLTGTSPITVKPWEAFHSPLTTDTSGGNVTLTLPTAALLLSQLFNPEVGDTFEIQVQNFNAANNIVVAAGSGGTVVNAGANFTLGPGTIGTYTVTFTNVSSGTEAYKVFGYKSV